MTSQNLAVYPPKPVPEHHMHYLVQSDKGPHCQWCDLDIGQIKLTGTAECDAPILDDTNYPTDRAIWMVEHWPTPEMRDYMSLIDFVGSLWSYPDRWRKASRARRDYKGGPRYQRVYVSTGGWSGNESLISALQDHKQFFWTFCWEQSRRGGHYIFRVPV